MVEEGVKCAVGYPVRGSELECRLEKVLAPLLWQAWGGDRHTPKPTLLAIKLLSSWLYFP